ncbi:UDP-glucose dehydrogenase family protein [Acidianus manzaensis]|uniref:UDP-glucose 6-dehydrogenase n=1 Tax=Acidianus manzaensis TaxID=282676 RepID=A0A1W6JWL0_9CREN|nr:UDP-glucose/GDP-mannose dehydrogenase family protein [Acidianus manzaensis]ARM74635.1 UDP-glucose 6-dehydrogenase [Acidianus manzaensis]
MKIGIVGLGVVGLSTGVVLADQGHEILGVDIDEKRVSGLECRKSPIYEPELQELLVKNFDKMKFSTDYSILSDADVIFITVSTPTVNGKIYLNYVFDASKKIAETVKKSSTIVIKSTVVPGTARKVKEILGHNLKVVVNPEFLKEGNAIRDTRNPDRIVIGSEDKESGDLIEKLWSFTNSPVIRTSFEEAEMIKYAANSFLALKISFINEIANLCEKLPNCDVEVIAKAIGFDKRISPYFLSAGLGWGGSCFPKDTLALTSFAREKEEILKTIEAAIEVNQERPARAIKMLKELTEIKGKTICVLGLAFKPNTDDTRESVALKIIDLLRKEGAKVIAYDPKAKSNVEMVTLDECISRGEGVIVATEWDEFRGLEEKLKGKFVVDGRRILDPSKMDRSHFRAVGLGV